MGNEKGPGKGKDPNSLKNLKPIKMGEVRNPLGYHSQDPVKRAIKKLTAPGWEEILQAVLSGDTSDLEAIANSKTHSILHIGVARALFNAAAAGNWDRLKDMVTTLLGPQAIKIDLTMTKNQDETPEEAEERRRRVAEKLSAISKLD